MIGSIFGFLFEIILQAAGFILAFAIIVCIVSYLWPFGATNTDSI